jgi:hypothetical protein
MGKGISEMSIVFCFFSPTLLLLVMDLGGWCAGFGVILSSLQGLP